MTPTELIAAPAGILEDEFHSRFFSNSINIGIRLIDREKLMFLFAVDERIVEEDKSWIDTRYMRVNVDLNGVWTYKTSFFK